MHGISSDIATCGTDAPHLATPERPRIPSARRTRSPDASRARQRPGHPHARPAAARIHTWPQCHPQCGAGQPSLLRPPPLPPLLPPPLRLLSPRRPPLSPPSPPTCGDAAQRQRRSASELGESTGGGCSSWAAHLAVSSLTTCSGRFYPTRRRGRLGAPGESAHPRPMVTCSSTRPDLRTAQSAAGLLAPGMRHRGRPISWCAAVPSCMIHV